MKRILYSLFFGALVINAGNAAAQCPTGRYNTELFPTFTKTTVVYSTPYNLEMDIYQPDGDTYDKRPVMILAHGGSFITGNKTGDPTVVALCENFAKRGFVTASINYRLGTLFTIADSATAIDIVVKAISDGKAAVRYFVKDAATTNIYKIDTNNIFAGGNSAGAVLFMHVGYITDITECPDYIENAMLANGGFEGNSGNDGYNTKTRAIVNLAGAVNKTSFISYHDIPSVNAQGTDDPTVPYDCDYPISGSIPVKLCGLGELEPLYLSQDIYHMSKIFPGDGHTPWGNATPEGAIKFNSVDSLVRVFAYSLLCPGESSVSTVKTQTEVSIFPNPAVGSVNISSDVAISTLSVYDQTGRTVITVDNINNKNVTINTAKLAKGMYIVRTQFANNITTPVVNNLVIE